MQPDIEGQAGKEERGSAPEYPKEVFIANAGQVLFAPWLLRLFDILLERILWGFRTIRLNWVNLPVRVCWR